MNASNSRTAWEYHINTSFMDDLMLVAELSQRHKAQLFKKAKFENIRAGKTLTGANESRWLTYVLKGRVSNTDQEQADKKHQDPLFYPHYKGSLKVLQDSMLVRFDRKLYENISNLEAQQNVSIDDVEMSDIEAAVFTNLIMDTETQGLMIPSLPDVAIKISTTVNREDANLSQLSKILLNDPVLCAKLIKYANSGLYAGKAKVMAISDALSRLGMKAIKSIVTSYAVAEVFKAPSPALQHKVEELYEHSIFISVMAYFLTKKYTRLEPEYALLTGLVHEIGMIPILNYMASHYPEDVDEQGLQSVSDKMVSLIGTMVLDKWGFDRELVQVVDVGVDYSRYGGEKADYADVLNVAHWCSAKYHVGAQQADDCDLPAIEEMPAFRKLGIEYLDESDFEAYVLQSMQTATSLHKLLGP